MLSLQHVCSSKWVVVSVSNLLNYQGQGPLPASCTSTWDRKVQFSAVSRGFAAHAAHHVAAPAARP